MPTLGSRPEYLQLSLQSIREAGDCWISLVAPVGFDSRPWVELGLANQYIEDPGKGLAAAINQGLRALPEDCAYVTWLGDDDLLTKESIDVTSSQLSNDEKLVFVFGSCEYIDSHGKRFWVNRSGHWAVRLMRIGPNMTPQPGSLLRRSSLNYIGLLDENLGWAFDQDMFTRLSKIGEYRYLPRILASFRWHSDSLSAGQSRESLKEASAVRVRHMPAAFKGIWSKVETLHIWLANLATPALDRKTSSN